MKKWNILVGSLALSIVVFTSCVRADPIKDPLPWVGPQVYSSLIGPGNWTPTDFAIARGDIRSVSNSRIAKDVLKKSGIDLPDILKTILIWSK